MVSPAVSTADGIVNSRLSYPPLITVPVLRNLLCFAEAPPVHGRCSLRFAPPCKARVGVDIKQMCEYETIPKICNTESALTKPS